jgi:hypothetical protein
MEIEVRFTTQASNEAERINTPWHGWPWLLFAKFQGLYLLVLVVIAGCMLLEQSLSTTRPDLSKATVGTVLVAAPLAGYRWLRHRTARRKAAMLAAFNPLKLRFDENGMHSFEKNGESNFVPWSGIAGFREGRSVIVLRRAGSPREYRAIPKNTVPPGDVERLRDAIRSRLPEIR